LKVQLACGFCCWNEHQEWEQPEWNLWTEDYSFDVFITNYAYCKTHMKIKSGKCLWSWSE
jgi:hypothetical protein